MLCDKCSLMFQGFQHLDQSHHTNLKSFTNAAEDGCYICAPLLKFVIKESGSLENCMYAPYTYRNFFGKMVEIVLRMLIKGEPRMISANYIICATSEVDMGIRDRELGKLGIPFSKAAQTSETWLVNCLKEHEDCQKKI